jgi:hypothetical protein
MVNGKLLICVTLAAAAFGAAPDALRMVKSYP